MIACACVYVLHQPRRKRGLPRPRRLVIPLKLCRDRAEAHTLAAAVHDLFECPAWVEDFGAPANLRTLEMRARSDEPAPLIAPDPRRI